MFVHAYHFLLCDFLCVSVPLWLVFLLRFAMLINQRGEALEEMVAVLRAGRSFGMVLHREDGLAFQRQALVRAVEQRDMGDPDAGRQRFRNHGEAMVLAGDLHLAGGEILHRMIGAAMTETHLLRA